MRFGQFAASCIVIGLLPAAPVRADPVAPALMVPALDLYVDTIAVGRAAEVACGGPTSALPNQNGWPQAKAVFIATLWASGFPPDKVAEWTRKLEAAPASPPDCADPVVAGNYSRALDVGWLMEVDQILSSMGLTTIHDPVDAGRWQQIKDVVAAELPGEKRMLDCVAVTFPVLMPVAVHDWDATIVGLAGKLAAAGLPHDEIAAALGAAEANTLWHRVAGDDATALRKSCDGDQTWSDRLYKLDGTGAPLAAAIDKLLPQPPADTAN